MPKNIPKHTEVLGTMYNCTLQAPFVNVSSEKLYRKQNNLIYPMNVGRNIARDAALTHFILASDNELYPSPGLVRKFLEMIARNELYLRRNAPRVFPLPVFEVKETAPVPQNKTELQAMLRSEEAIKFHEYVCPLCHAVPKGDEWIAANETEKLSVFHIGKRTGAFENWEPFYIGTSAEPLYDERLNWDGKRDKMAQGYALCVLDYEFHILDNAFLVHKPGIKVYKWDEYRERSSRKTNEFIDKTLYPELRLLYGTREGCVI